MRRHRLFGQAVRANRRAQNGFIRVGNKAGAIAVWIGATHNVNRRERWPTAKSTVVVC